MPTSENAQRADKVLVYDFNSSGHCPGWMHLAAMGFRQAGADVLVACRLEAPEVKPWVERLTAGGCRVLGVVSKGICHASHAAALARQEGIGKVFFPNFDSVIYEMGKLEATDALAGLDIGGIWLRPELAAHNRGALRRIIEKLIRTRANKLRRKHERAVRNNRRGLAGFLPTGRAVAGVRLFFTSEPAAAEVEKLLPGETRQICDPWLTRGNLTRSDALSRLGMDDSRVILLHLGTSRPEKGLKDACQALLRLDDDIMNRLLLLRAGTVDRSDALSLKRLEDRGGARVIDRYMSEEELSWCYAASDRVLLPYRNQSETSGVLIHAVAHGKPVIASDYGWIGSVTRAYGLGWLYPQGDGAALAALMAKAAAFSDGWDVMGMERFAANNSPEKFQHTLVEQWLREPADADTVDD